MYASLPAVAPVTILRSMSRLNCHLTVVYLDHNFYNASKLPIQPPPAFATI